MPCKFQKTFGRWGKSRPNRAFSDLIVAGHELLATSCCLMKLFHHSRHRYCSNSAGTAGLLQLPTTAIDANSTAMAIALTTIRILHTPFPQLFTETTADSGDTQAA